MLSAKRKKVSYFETNGKSLMYNKTSKGPSTEPYGSPQVISEVSEILPQTDTYCCLFRHDLNHSRIMPLVP